MSPPPHILLGLQSLRTRTRKKLVQFWNSSCVILPRQANQCEYHLGLAPNGPNGKNNGTFLPRFRLPWSQFKTYFMFKLERVMDGFCASAPQQRGQQNPNVDYVPYEQMKGRILKIVDDFHGWVKASTSTDYKGLESVAHICIFLDHFSEFHSLFSVFANSSQTRSETTRELTSFSWAWRRWAPPSV